MSGKTAAPVAKEIVWLGSSLKDLLDFPVTVRKEAGYQLHRVQYGLEPEDWKPFTEVGCGGDGDSFT